MKKHIVTIVLAGIPAWASAQTPLSADELRGLIVGRTVEMTVHDRNLSIKNYYSADGTVVGFNIGGGTPFPGKWSISESGQLCTSFPARPNFCGNVIKMSDGSFRRMDGDKPFATWNRVVDGNTAK